MATKEKVRIERSKAIALANWCGWKTANKWKNDKASEKLKNVKVARPDEDPEDAEIAATLIEVEAAIEDGLEFEVYDGPVAESKDEDPEEAEKTAEPEKKEEKAETKPKDDGKKEEAKKPEKAEKAEKAEKTEKKKKEGPEHIRPQASRAYYAGVVLKKHGLAKGITKEMIDEVDKLFGKANEDQSWGRLATAWHALNGYTEEFPVNK